MPTITYRAIGADGEPQWGQGQANFLSDLNAVGQAVLTRLRLFEGEWWADQLDGTPYWQSILGKSASDSSIAVVTQIIVQRILGTPFVLPGGIKGLSSSFDTASQTYNFYAVVNTQFGAVAVANAPVPPMQNIV